MEYEFALTYKDEKTKNGVLWESHCHDRFELIAVFAGSVAVSTEGRQIPLSNGSVIVIPPLTYHTVTACGNARYERISVLFDPDGIPAPLRDKLLLSAKSAKPLLSCDLSELKKFSPHTDEAFYRPLLDALLVRLLYAYTEEMRTDEDGAADSFLVSTLSSIEAHLCEKISLDDIALTAACSKSTLCHLFKEKMGITVKQYVIEKRMALASKMMREGEAPSSVATAVGYENYSNFYRIYQKHTGFSPSLEKRRR